MKAAAAGTRVVYFGATNLILDEKLDALNGSGSRFGNSSSDTAH
jgi:hypothetical protein